MIEKCEIAQPPQANSYSVATSLQQGGEAMIEQITKCDCCYAVIRESQSYDRRHDEQARSKFVIILDAAFHVNTGHADLCEACSNKLLKEALLYWISICD
jgi:hypothetical protein